jgi:hypothetical protein
MKNNNKNAYKMGLTLGILGFLAGIGLLFSGNRLIGIFGSLASAGLILKGYKDMKEVKNQENDLE